MEIHLFLFLFLCDFELLHLLFLAPFQYLSLPLFPVFHFFLSSFNISITQTTRVFNDLIFQINQMPNTVGISCHFAWKHSSPWHPFSDLQYTHSTWTKVTLLPWGLCSIFGTLAGFTISSKNISGCNFFSNLAPGTPPGGFSYIWIGQLLERQLSELLWVFPSIPTADWLSFILSSLPNEAGTTLGYLC